MMKKLTKAIIASVLLIIIFAYGCTNSPKTQSGNSQKIKIAATIFPIYDFTREIGGKYVDAVLILPPGSSPHTFSPKISDVKKIVGAKVLFYNNSGLDEWAVKLAKSANVKAEINVNKEIQDVINAHNGNPHVWLNPELAESECRVIADTLENLDPEHKKYYETNYKNYTALIEKTAKSLKEKLNSVQNRSFIAFHPAYTYFAEYFGLKEIAVIEKIPGQKPTPKEIINIEDLIKKYRIKAIFSEPQLHSDIVNAIAKDTGINIGILDPLGGTDERNSYVKLLIFDVNAIIEAIK
jgi:zinc transport system substrate-binding protein